MRRFASPLFLLPGLLLLPLAGCHESYSPNTYSADAAQQAAPVQRGVIVGVRQVLISSTGTTGAAAGAAVGGIAGAQLPTTALGAVGGALVGGIGGAAAEKAVADTNGWEYIVQETNGNLVSVTQTSKTALAIGTHVLVIDGNKQARIIPDYTVPLPASAPAAAKESNKTAPPATPAPAASATAPTQGGATGTAAPAASSSPAAASNGSAAASAQSTATPAASATAASAAAANASSPDTSKQDSAALPADVTNDPILLQAQTPSSGTSSASSSGATTTTSPPAASPASSGSSTAASSTTTTQPAGAQ